MLADGESFTPKQNAGLLSQLDILKECEKIWTDGLARASENRYAVMRSDVDTVKYSKKNDNSSIREQLRENLNKLADMKPVADVKYESIKHFVNVNTKMHTFYQINMYKFYDVCVLSSAAA